MLVDTVHGLKRSDEALLQALRENAISHQIVLSKVDRLLFPGTRKPSIQLLNRHKIEVRRRGESIRARLDAMNVQGPKALGEIIACSTEASLEKGKCLGINNLRWSILTATGLNEVRRDSFMYEPSTAQTLAREPPTAAS